MENQPEQITPLPSGINRPYWSVMVPVYNPDERYLRKALVSILQQSPGSDRMQIEVVDDHSPDTDVSAMVARIGGSRVSYYRSPKNLGLAGGWNTCIQRAQGTWVHILHQDDHVLTGFYKRLEQAAEAEPDTGLIASRSFFVDKDDVINGVTPFLPKMAKSTRAVDAFFYRTPIQCAGVAVRRSFYEKYGGFKKELRYTLDVERWSKAVAQMGGVVVPEVLSNYRMNVGSETGRLSRSGETLRDYDRLNTIFAKEYPGFDRAKADRYLLKMAREMVHRYALSNDQEAMEVHRTFLHERTSLWHRVRLALADRLRVSVE